MVITLFPMSLKFEVPNFVEDFCGGGATIEIFHQAFRTKKSDSFSFFLDFCFTFLRTILRNLISSNLFNEYLITFKIF